MGSGYHRYSRRKIITLGREIGSVKPAYISQGWGPQRHSNGENTSRAIAMLAILTGNVGINGGNSGAREGSYSLPFVRMPTFENPVKPVSLCSCGPMPLSVDLK